MKMVKSLLLGSAAGLVAVAGAQAADLPVKAKPVQYVKICSLYGAGFYYIPGTDTCIKIGGYVRAEWNYQADNSFKPFIATSNTSPYNFDDPSRNRYRERTRGGITVDTRSQTAYGTLRSYVVILPTFSDDVGNGGSAYATPGVYTPALFIQFAGFTFGKTTSFFDFDTNPYTNATLHWGSSQAGNGQQVFAYTAQFGNGFSASLSIENPTSRRSDIISDSQTSTPSTGGTYTNDANYGGRRWPDLVANLRIDQAWGSAQIMGAIHDVYAATDSRYTQVAGSLTPVGAGFDTDDVGFAVGAGIRINLPMIGAGDYLIAQVNYAEGAINYVMNQAGAGGNVADLQDGFPNLSSRAVGVVADGTITNGAGNMDLTTGWSVTAGFEHRWNPQWKTSIYGTYGEIDYSAAASAVIFNNFVGTGAFSATGSKSADWSMWQIGSRTVWTPVANLDLSVDVLYTKVNTGFEGTLIDPADTSGVVPAYSFQDKDIFSAMFRAQRNFWP